MEISGKVIAILPLATGEGKNGTWRSQDFVIETLDQYPKKVCLNCFGDKINLMPNIGDEINAGFDIESREYNGRWFTSCKVWQLKINKAASAPNQAAPVHVDSINPNDDLPF